MQGSINFDGSLVGNITGGGGGGGSEVVITPVLTSGTKIADVTVDGENKNLFAPTPTPPTPATEVSVTQTLASGTKIGSIEVDGENTDLFAPTPTPPTPATEVSVTQTLASGTKIGSIEVDGESTDLYAPYQSAVNTSYDNTISGFTADNVQEAIDEISGITGDGQLDIGDDLTDAVNKIKSSLSDLIPLEKTASGAIVTFDDGSDLPMPSLKVAIKPVQSGSGDPSPTNVRPISGWDDVNVTVANDIDNPTVENVYTINLDGTRYGGTLDVVSGVLTVEWIAVSLGNINYTKSPSGLFQTNEIASAVKKSSYSYAPTGYIKSSHFREIDSASITGPQGSNPSPDGVMAVSSSGMLYINYWAVTDVADFKTAMANATLIYELATPLTIQLTPTQVTSLLGVNNIYADTGDLELTYFVNNSLVQAIYDMLNIFRRG